MGHIVADWAKFVKGLVQVADFAGLFRQDHAKWDHRCVVLTREKNFDKLNALSLSKSMCGAYNQKNL
jgi:hypothetical protein